MRMISAAAIMDCVPAKGVRVLRVQLRSIALGPREVAVEGDGWVAALAAMGPLEPGSTILLTVENRTAAASRTEVKFQFGMIADFHTGPIAVSAHAESPGDFMTAVLSRGPNGGVDRDARRRVLRLTRRWPHLFGPGMLLWVQARQERTAPATPSLPADRVLEVVLREGVLPHGQFTVVNGRVVAAVDGNGVAISAEEAERRIVNDGRAHARRYRGGEFARRFKKAMKDRRRAVVRPKVVLGPLRQPARARRQRSTRRRRAQRTAAARAGPGDGPEGPTPQPSAREVRS